MSKTKSVKSYIGKAVSNTMNKLNKTLRSAKSLKRFGKIFGGYIASPRKSRHRSTKKSRNTKK